MFAVKIIDYPQVNIRNDIAVDYQKGVVVPKICNVAYCATGTQYLRFIARLDGQAVIFVALPQRCEIETSPFPRRHPDGARMRGH